MLALAVLGLCLAESKVEWQPISYWSETDGWVSERGRAYVLLRPDPNGDAKVEIERIASNHLEWDADDIVSYGFCETDKECDRAVSGAKVGGTPPEFGEGGIVVFRRVTGRVFGAWKGMWSDGTEEFLEEQVALADLSNERQKKPLSPLTKTALLEAWREDLRVVIFGEPELAAHTRPNYMADQTAALLDGTMWSGPAGDVLLRTLPKNDPAGLGKLIAEEVYGDSSKPPPEIVFKGADKAIKAVTSPTRKYLFDTLQDTIYSSVNAAVPGKNPNHSLPYSTRPQYEELCKDAACLVGITFKECPENKAVSVALEKLVQKKYNISTVILLDGDQQPDLLDAYRGAAYYLSGEEHQLLVDADDSRRPFPPKSPVPTLTWDNSESLRSDGKAEAADAQIILWLEPGKEPEIVPTSDHPMRCLRSVKTFSKWKAVAAAVKAAGQKQIHDEA